ncbi:MAG: PDZ domain-containing protein [Nitrospirae bacterium]|nr:MAG: PDZ domain-containing protein [Nitrospirota bacterium]
MDKLIRTLLPFCLLLIPAIAFAEPPLPQHDLRVRFDLARNALIGVSTISVSERKDIVISLAGLRVLSVTLNGMHLELDTAKAEVPLKSFHAGNVVRVEYEVSFAAAAGTDRSRNPGVVRGNQISSDGIFLADGWYPSLGRPAVFSLTATLPAGFEGISEADAVVVREMPDGEKEFSFDFRHPANALHLIAGKYVVGQDAHNGIGLYTYFLSDDAEMSRTYIDYTKKYLALYETLLGRYPYKRFSIIEHALPAGNAMPTFTLLGQDIVRLPFIVETSLGHEILHQWFGSSVLVDYSSGNWAEGLTSYLADHRYKELAGAGAAYRKQVLGSYQSFVTPDNDFPLTSFAGRTDKASAAIGYNKAAMVFHMLRGLLGDEAFHAGLRNFYRDNLFRPASWKDLITAFEAVHNKKLDWFFRQWVEEKGQPVLEVRDLVMTYRGSKARISFDLLQQGKAYTLSLPVLIRTAEGGIRKTIEIDKAVNHVEIDAEGSPLELVIDEGYDIFRRLSDEETPPLISRLFGDAKRLVVLPETETGPVTATSGFFNEMGFSAKKSSEVSYDDIRSSSLLILGSDNALSQRLFARLRQRDADLQLITRENPFNKNGVAAVLDWDLSADISRYLPKISHYGTYSILAFRDGKNIQKVLTEKDPGIRSPLSKEPEGVEVRKLTRFNDIIGGVSAKKIIYVGETHDKFEHHRTQFEVIRALQNRGNKIAIGMEMFQKPFQQALDDYIDGKTDERTFLKRSEYFKRWGFDYNLYREILLYAREQKIPVIALNIRKEIVSKVSKEGIQALTKDELSEVPADMDLADRAYRARLRESFLRHQGSDERTFDFFHQAQVLWDEAMALNLNDFILKNPGRQVVVLAGSGHMLFGSGIPKRLQRRNGLDYAILLSSGEAEEDVADFILYPEPVKYQEAPKLMVMFKEEGTKVRITGFLPDSISEKAGLKKGDIIISLDDVKVEGIDDLKLHLLYKKKGESLVVRVLRSRFLLGPAERVFTIAL